MSMTSGACGPGLSLLALMASISSAELPSGLSSLIGMPYLAVNAVEHLAVVAPGVRQGDGREAALGLGRGDQRVHVDGAAEAPAEQVGRCGADAGVDARAVGEAELPLDEQAANTKIAPTRRPANRVTERCVDKIRPPVACAIDVSKTVEGLLPRDERRAHPSPCGGRRHALRGLRVHWTSPLRRASRASARIVNAASSGEHRSHAWRADLYSLTIRRRVIPGHWSGGGTVHDR